MVSGYLAAGPVGSCRTGFLGRLEKGGPGWGSAVLFRAPLSTTSTFSPLPDFGFGGGSR